MGTNYYAHINCCEHCKRPEKILHIGKSSGGWTFSFRGYRRTWDDPKLSSWTEWQAFLSQPDIRIMDEYDQIHGFHSFREMVETKKSEPMNHYQYCRRKHPSLLGEQWLDDQGNSFSECEFS